MNVPEAYSFALEVDSAKDAGMQFTTEFALRLN